MKPTDDTKPLVSIIVVTYNSSPYVIETLESAKKQTYGNIELIVTDDCSEDDTVQICKGWLEKNKDRFTRTEIVTVKKNTGTSSNINRGINAANGKFIKETAGDDILLKNCVEDNVEFALKNKASFVFSDMMYFRKNELNQYDDVDENERMKKITSMFLEFAELDSGGQIIFYSRNPIFINSPTWFYAKGKIPPLDQDFRLVEDQPLIFRYLQTKEKIFYLNKTTIRYRRYHDSKNLTKYLAYFDDFIRCFKKYRRKNLKRTSIIDLTFIANFYIGFVLKQWSNKSIINRAIVFPIKKLNPVNIFKISPSDGLSQFKVDSRRIL